MTSRRIFIAGALVVVVVATVLGYWVTHPAHQTDQLVLYGNVDLREVDLPFNGNERIAAVLVQEGDVVHKGEVLAKMDVSRLKPELEQAEAEVAAQKAVVERLHHGSRPQEIAQARANLESAHADAANARVIYQREMSLLEKGSATEQDRDNAKAAMDVADAKVDVNEKALDLAIAGPRAEDVAQGEAQLSADEAQLALIRAQFADTVLKSPTDGIVRSRLLEPGDMASPSKPVVSIAITSPKWVRAYVSEPDLGRVHPGMPAFVMVDSFPNRRFAGWVGFISPVAEFTPKSVETEELRTSLVYEVRVFVKDSGNVLRLGMPATVDLSLQQDGAPQKARHR